MKVSKRGVLLAIFGLSTFTGWAQTWPFGASDPVYGLRSRADTNPGYQYFPSPEDWRDINIYQIFTDRFADGDDSNNPRTQGWYQEGKSFPANRNFHHGGDWKGLKNNLDYLSGMGVRAVWISGVQMNDQGKDKNYTPYHMYHPTDFFRVDPVMGTFQDLKDVIDACHARGIYVILDVVINHTADKNGIDNDTGYFAFGGSNHRWWDTNKKHAAPFNDLQWFHNNGTINNWDSFPEYIYGQFKGTDDLATEKQQVKDWLDQAFKNLIDATDCDGFRVDAIKHVDYDWIKAWADNMRKHAAFRGKNDFILFGEYFSYDNNTLASHCKEVGYSFNSALFFPLSQNIKSVFIDNQWAGQLTQQLNNRSLYGEGANRLVAFIDNHDVNRISLLNGGDTGNDVWKLGPALSFLYLATPVPCLFYGTEHAFDQGGHYNGSNRTADNPDDGDWQRECMFDRGFQPGPAQGNKLAATTAPLYLHIKGLNAARAKHRSLTRGSFQERWADTTAYAFSRVFEQEEALVALNLQDGNRSLNPSVGKPDGTEFVNALNPADKVTVSGGKLTFNMTGKETKIYVAGIVTPAKWIKGTHNSPADGAATSLDTIYVNTEAGPTGVVSSVNIGYTSNGTNWSVLAMNATNWNSQGGTWYNARLGAFPPGTVIKYYIEAADTNASKVWDNNNGQNYSITIKAPPGAWIRGIQNYPLEGAATDLSPIFIDAEAGPTGVVTGVTISYSTNGTTWTKLPMNLNTNWLSNGGSWFNINLGAFRAGTQLRYYIEAASSVSTNKNDNGGLNYTLNIRNIADELWVGNTRHTPVNGNITPVDPVAVRCETWPLGIATNVSIVYSTDGLAWNLQGLTKLGSTNDNDRWGIDLGPYPDGTIISYALVAQSQTIGLWDNNGGANYIALIGEPGVRMVPYSPVINAGGSPDNLNDVFDFNLVGGAAKTSGTNGFGSFGDVYVNYDATYLYIGAASVSMPTDSFNNAYAIFLGGGSQPGSGNLWNFSGAPEGLDLLHNVAFQPAVNVAILLGDVYGDGTYGSFNMYRAGGFNFGQGVFALPAGGTNLLPVAGARLSQFGAYGYSNRLAANWECAIPLAAFGVTNAASLTNLYVSGLMVTGSTTNNNRFVSGRYLGDSASLGNGELPDAWGNFAFSFVNLGGTRIIPPVGKIDLGIPDSWIATNFPNGYSVTTNSDNDADGCPDRHEYFAGLDPKVQDDLDITGFGSGRLRVRKVGGQPVKYLVDVADRIQGGDWNWSPYMLVNSVDGEVSVPPPAAMTNALMRIRVAIPGLDQPAERINLSATPGGGSFSADSINITLNVSGIGVASSTYTVQGESVVAYADGQVIAFGAGMTNGQVKTLTLNGSTTGGTTSQVVYTYTKTTAPLQLNWTGSVLMNPAAGSWDTNETLTVTFATAPVGAAASVGMVASTDGATWSYTNLTKTGTNSSNDLWSVTLPAYPAGTLLQFALEAKDLQNNSTWNNNNNLNYSITVNGGGSPAGTGKFTPYSTNPTKGQYRATGITIDGANTSGEWTTNMLIALDLANDDPRTLGSNWTLHEAPADVTHLWACWDDTKVYLAWQFVDVTDKLDPSNAGSALGGRVSNSQGILQFISIDTLNGAGAVSNMWSKNDRMTGLNLPDYQIGLRSDLFSAYISRSVDGKFAGDSSLGTNYFTAAGRGITIARAPGFAAPSLLGPWDLDTYLANTNSALTEYVSSGHDTTRDSFYEMAIPLTALGITRAQLESGGIGIFINVGSTSSIDCIPNDTATLNSPGVTGSNSSFEWEDVDQFTAPYARVGM